MFPHHRSAVSSQDESGVESEAQSLPELFSLICEAKEIQEGIQLRWGERSTLNGLNGNGKKNSENCQLRFQIPGKVSTNADKVNILLQAQVSGHYIVSAFHILQNAQVTSNKMVHKKRQHFLAQFSTPFYMG